MAANNLSYQYKMANVVIKLIVINVAIFLISSIIPWVLAIDSYFLKQWFVLPAALTDLIIQPWSLITYAFLHADFWHIFWNMIVLYWFGNLVLNLFQGKRLLTIYMLGALAGGALFVIAYNLFPVFRGELGYLQGASAAVMAIMIFIATYTPNTEVRVIFFNVKLWQIGVFFVLMDLLQVSGSPNAGGLIAHMGGALLGYIYAQQLAKGNDIGIWWENFIDTLASYFKKREKPAKMKTVYRKKNGAKNAKTTAGNTLSKSEQQRKIDTILDKISKSGYDSLSKQEKDFLFKAGKDS